MSKDTIKPAGRYLTLDAYRGVAALAVAWHHCAHAFGLAEPRFAYLAVDLFFALSGFVLHNRHGSSLSSSLPPNRFFTDRLIRLTPMLFIGGVVGAVCMPGISIALRPAYAILASLGLPQWESAATHRLFPIDPPLWSIFFELYVANLLYAFFLHRLPRKALLMLVGISAVALVYAEHHFKTLNVGWGIETAVFGVPRVLYSFIVGMFIAESGEAEWRRFAHPLACVAAVLLLLLMPAHSGKLSHLYEVMTVLVLFPGLVFLGACKRERRPWLGAMLGEQSYAMYAIHQPIVVAFTGLALVLPLQQRWLLLVSILIALVPLSLFIVRVAEPKLRSTLRRSLSKEARPKTWRDLGRSQKA